jgi:CheY-like chemotaxis protein
MENGKQSTIGMHTLLLCGDVQFVGITRSVLNELRATPQIVARPEEALGLIRTQEFDLIVVDWREIDNIADFLSELRRSKLNHECVLVAIVRDLLDLRQAFAAGVHLLIHKPASALQIERCLRAAYCATVSRRRKLHREPVKIVASIRTRTQALGNVLMRNLSEGGAGFRIESGTQESGGILSAGDEVTLSFALPGFHNMLNVDASVVWTSGDLFGIQFGYVPEDQMMPLQSWLTECVERSLAEFCERMKAACA